MNIKKEVIDMCLEVIEMEAGEIGLDEEFQQFSHIDSLKSLDILTAVECRFNIKIPEQELREFTSINNVIKVVDRYISSHASSQD